MGMLFSSAFMLQGCAALAWIGLMSTDMDRCNELEFTSFEHASVAPPEQIQRAPLKHIAVIPITDDMRMAKGWANVLAHMPNRSVLGPEEISSRLLPNMHTQLAQRITDQDDIALAQQISQSVQPIDTVLFGKIIGGPPQKSFWRLKEKYPQRLYLSLVSAEGTVLWKSELPFIMLKGIKDVDEEVVKRRLLTYVTKHSKEWGWTPLGLTLEQTESETSPVGPSETQLCNHLLDF
jgi:hypothetical protein